jgi:fibronectin type 3 domain-containing protein
MNRLKSILYSSIVLVVFSILLLNLSMAAEELRKPQWINLAKEVESVKLQWFRVQNAVAYIVERRVGEDGDFKQVARVTIPTFNDLDVVPDQVYFYRIIPLDKAGIRGSASEVNYIRLEPVEQGVISPPLWGAYLVGEDGIALTWRHEQSDRVLAYNLYRKKEGESEYTLIVGSLSSSYLDRDVSAEHQYSYVLTALDKKLQESVDSSTLTVRFAKISRAAPEDEKLEGIKTIEEVVRQTQEDRIYSWERFGFLCPVDVEYHAPEDRLYVSDSCTGLITVIGPNGEMINQLGGIGVSPWEFDRLLGIDVDPGGYVYAVDAYRGEIVVFSSQGSYVRRIRLEGELREYFGPDFKIRYPGFRFGIVDVEVTGEGYLAVVDNPNGWVYLIDTNGTLIRVIGEKGYEPGKLHYPTFVFVDTKNRFIVSDTLNSRVQVFDADGSHLKIIGGKGPGIGQFLRPKGVAADDYGNLYVAFIGLLGDEKGLPIDLGSPNGITFIGPDRLVISERLSRRIHVRRLLKPLAAVSSGEKVPGARQISQVTVDR